MQKLIVSQVARRLSQETGQTVSPQDISNFFYKRHLDDDRCPIVGRCRLIPEDYVATIKRVLFARGLVSACAKAVDPTGHTPPSAISEEGSSCG